MWRRRSLTRWSGTRLDRVLRQAGPGHNTLLRTVHANAERLCCVSDDTQKYLSETYPAIIILVKHADQRASLELEFVSHRRLKVKLYTVDIVRASGRSVRTTGSSSSASDPCNYRRTHSR